MCECAESREIKRRERESNACRVIDLAQSKSFPEDQEREPHKDKGHASLLAPSESPPDPEMVQTQSRQGQGY